MSKTVSLAETYRDYFKIGMAVNPMSVSRYGDLIKYHCNSLTCENEMKPASLHPEPGVYSFERADIVADFARQNGIPMRGHTFVWHGQTPRWFFDDEHKDNIIETLRDHMTTVSGRYSDLIYTWDVVNEAINDGDGETLRERTPYLSVMDRDYLHTVFALAKSILPENTKLAYNDYNECDPRKSARIIEAVKNINRDGKLVDVIGMQAHWHIDAPDYDTIRRTIENYAALGCNIQVTELDVSMHDWGEAPDATWETPERIAAHAKYYGDIFAIFREYKDVIDSVTLWGVTDGTSWLNGFPVRGRRDSAMLFTDDGAPKEAFFRITEF